MTSQMITCSMCGHHFDPAAHLACQGCPLQKGCQLVCCPACGYENVDVRRSSLARLAARWLSSDTSVLTLADIAPGRGAYLQGFAPTLPEGQQAHLQAYGLVPGHWVKVIQHTPVTVLQIEHTELALEQGLARQIRVVSELG